jgi:hypothetical protein
LSESGCPGFEDLEDKRKIIILVVEKPIYMGAHFSNHNISIIKSLSFVKSKLSESGYPGLKDLAG